MKLPLTLLLGLYTLASTSPTPNADNDPKPYKPKYRISPIDGSKIALPTKPQLDFQDKEIGLLIHFNIATYLSIDGCNNVPELVPETSLFDPALLNTDQWMNTISAVGGKYATLVVKHNCGFTLWPSDVSFETRDGKTVDYNYTIAHSPAKGQDIVRKFVNSAKKYNIGHGFYYSVVVNNFLNVQDSEVRNGSLADGQIGITNNTYNEVVLEQLDELWSQYGDLTEIWFDGGYSSTQKNKIQSLLEDKQPQAVIFNGCQTDGTCISPNSVRWIGTEEGKAPEENWSTGITEDGGSPSSPYFCPSECDTPLQKNGRWFYGSDTGIRSLGELISVYHNTVGRNCILELDLTPDTSGLIPNEHVERYKQLGEFVEECYGDEVRPDYVVKGGGGEGDGVYIMGFHDPTPVDRIMLMEDQSEGQVIREFNVSGRVFGTDSKEGKDGDGNGEVRMLAKGGSIGHKRIAIFEEPVEVTEIVVRTTFVDVPRWRSVSVHLCDKLPSSSSSDEDEEK